jgi:hypothetical protein
MIEQLLREKFENPNFDNPTGQEPNPKAPEPPPQPKQKPEQKQEVASLYEEVQPTTNQSTAKINNDQDQKVPEKTEKKKKETKSKIQFDDFELPKIGRKKIFFTIPIVVLLIVAGIGGIVLTSLYKKEAANLILYTNSITTKFDEIDSEYQDIQRTRAEDTISVERENGLKVLGDTSEKLSLVRYYNDINRVDPEVIENVLGLEDDTPINQMRKEKSVYLDLEQIYFELEESTNDFKDSYEKVKIVNLLRKDLGPPIQETLDHAAIKLDEVDNTIKVYDVIILYTTWAYEVRLAIHESVLRKSDDFSISKLENKLYEVDEFRDRARSINPEALNDEMEVVHNELTSELTSSEGTVSLLQQLVGSLKKNDPVAFEKSLVSIEAHSQEATVGNNVENSHVYDIIRSDIKKLKDKWVTVREVL